MKNKILFVTYGGGHAKIILPIVKALKKQADYEIYILALTTATAYFKENGIDTFGFKDILPLFTNEEQKQIINYGRALAENNSVVDYNESIAYMGISYFELVNLHGEDKANSLLEKKGRAAFLPEVALTKFLSSISPRVLVTTVSPRAEQAAIIAAKALSIPSVCINDFINNNSAKRVAQTEPDITCVISKGVANQINILNDTLDIRVTGNPAFDRLANLNYNRLDLIKKIGVSGKKKVILWAAQREHDIHPFTGKEGKPLLPRMVEAELVKIALDDKFDIILRSHPNDIIDYEQHQNIIDGNDFSLDELLYVCDVVITISSTVGYEGLLLGKGLLTIEGATINEDGPYNEVGLSMPIFDLNDIGDSLSIVLEDRKSIVGEGSLLGKATNNICKIIEELISE
ncbi:hypothetical protein [Vibrio nereis]|uniref:UDP-N-acetylglucosamine 2-epimerase domain-containing protein n=1 Tax=Vibrio nereis TaxID=693 RepID=A0A0M0HJI5_VIBNE|nr:hypothetical protein [Vibrio nereis]KOO02249.1 hypothetical protein AKJ17_16300 [Vibrio nereis]